MGQDILSQLIPDFQKQESKIAISEWRENSNLLCTYQELGRLVERWRARFLSMRLSRGDRVALLSESRIVYPAILYAAWLNGLVIVPLDAKSTPSEIAEILRDCRARVLVHSHRFETLAKALKNELASISFRLSVDEDFYIRSEDIVAPGYLTSGDTALLVYTSGTTGLPKGVMITFGNLIFEIKTLAHKMKVRPQDCFLSLNPLNHLFELTCTLLSGLKMQIEVCFCSSLYPQDIFPFMRERGVTRMNVVPLFLRLLKNEIERQMAKRSSWVQGILVGLSSVSKKIPKRELRRPLFPFIYELFGSRFREFVSGGAPLDPEIGRFFENFGIAVYQGYGMTEAGPVIATNNRHHNRVASVGKPLPGVEIKIDKIHVEDEVGEILVRGPNVMKGYFEKPDLTLEAVDSDGWLHTGDLGRLDREGFLYISGRNKNLIVLPGGKKVQPEEVEELASRSALIREICVVAKPYDDGPFKGMSQLSAVIVPSESLVREVGEEGLEEVLQLELKKTLGEIATYKHPQRILIRREELPKSTTRKVKRNLVVQWFESIEGQA